MIKKLLFSFGIVTIGAAAVQAQITITSNDIAAIGKVIKQANDTLPTVAPGPSGANVTWNFTALNNHYLDTLTFTNPAWTPNGNQFPTSNLAVNFGSQGTTYALLNSSTFNILGQAGTFNAMPLVIKDNPVEVLIQFPSTYNSTFTNSNGYDFKFAYTQQPGIDSIRVKHNSTKKSNVNAWGTVTTPLLSNTNCIRQRTFMHNFDTVFAHITFPPGWQVVQNTEDSTVHFAWWANGIGFPLVEMDSAFDGTISGVTWLQATPTNSGVSEISNLVDIKVYPNPANTTVYFNFDGTDASSVSVMDVQGREIGRFLVNTNIESMNVNDLSAGMYFYRVMNDKGQLISRGKFSVVK
ncbi:MAG TPA: T9SS type A sorting domain-containing protein [Bacteroidia bacterium]